MTLSYAVHMQAATHTKKMTKFGLDVTFASTGVADLAMSGKLNVPLALHLISNVPRMQTTQSDWRKYGPTLLCP